MMNKYLRSDEKTINGEKKKKNKRWLSICKALTYLRVAYADICLNAYTSIHG